MGKNGFVFPAVRRPQRNIPEPREFVERFPRGQKHLLRERIVRERGKHDAQDKNKALPLSNRPDHFAIITHIVHARLFVTPRGGILQKIRNF